MIILGTFGGGYIIVIIIFLLLIAFMIWRTVKYFKKKAEQGKLKQSLLTTFGIIFVIIIGLTIPFHYMPSEGKVFTKANFTFKNTFITNDDVKEIIERYNDASFMEKIQMRSDPFIETLMKEGIIKEEKHQEDYYE